MYNKCFGTNIVLINNNSIRLEKKFLSLKQPIYCEALCLVIRFLVYLVLLFLFLLSRFLCLLDLAGLSCRVCTKEKKNLGIKFLRGNLARFFIYFVKKKEIVETGV